MDMLRKGSKWLAKMSKEHVSEMVTVRRGASSATLARTLGKTDFQTIDTSGVMVNVESRDYLVDVADYQFDDVAAVPTTGDQFIEGDLSQGLVYQVMAIAGHPCFRFSDAYRKRYRIHTKFVGTLP